LGAERFWDATPPSPESLVVDIRYLRNLLSKPLTLKNIRESIGITDKYLLDGFQASTMPLDSKSFQTLVESLGTDKSLIYENIEAEPLDHISQIHELESKYEFATPEVKETISRRIERGKIANDFKKAAGYKCMVCESLGLNPITFYKKNNEPYVEVHHVIPIANLRVGTLGPSNLITVCANHHRQLHYGNAELVESNSSEFIFRIDESIVHIRKLSI
jgi:5-methylcytosine-specific restriction endonuclease McrA